LTAYLSDTKIIIIFSNINYLEESIAFGMDSDQRIVTGSKFIILICLSSFLFALVPTKLLNEAASSSGITKLGNLGDRIEGLDFNSGVFFGNVETCSDATTCIGTNNDDIIYGGVREQVFGLKGEDMIFGSLDSQLYGQQGDDLILVAAGHNLVDGGNGDDTMLGGIGNDLLTGGKGNDKLFAGTGDSVLDGGPGANHFDCPISLLGLARAVVLDYNPDNGDTIAGQCKIVNTVGSGSSANVPEIDIPT
jgi:Ca2+-binding RTX toxin-like protein